MNERLDILERTIGTLAREVRALREAVNRLEANAATRNGAGHEANVAATPLVTEIVQSESAPQASAFDSPPPEPLAPDLSSLPGPPRRVERQPSDRRTGPDRRSLDFESLVGRYGTLSLASLTILMGAGAFLRWAIANGKIGPEMRVLLGALGAVAVAVVGWRLRTHGSKRFGSTLLALALALVHVDAWGAGPYLKLVPSWVALGIAAAASVAVAALAWLSDEEALFSVGVGGALLAPFVTSSDAGSPVLLLAYGYVVLGSGLAALRGRSWRAALIVVTLGCWLYTGTATAAITSADPQRVHNAPAIFAIAIAWTALALTRGPWGARIARSALVALAGTLLEQLSNRTIVIDVMVLAAIGTLTAYAAVHIAAAAVDSATRRQPLFTAAVLPLALGTLAAMAAPDTATARSLVMVAWTVVAIVAAFLQPAARPTHLMVAGITSGAAIFLALDSIAVASCIALAAHAAALALLLRRERTRLLSVPIALSLTIATMWAFTLLGRRPLYEYTPFLTSASLAAAAVATAWLIVSWNASRVELDDPRAGSVETRTALRLAGAVVTFMWGNNELSRAYSADVSTFLLVLYYAVVGVAAIFVGRARGMRVLRRVGLGLAIFAALKAIAEASDLVIGLRVASYLLAGLFLLAVAYWYRETDIALKLPEDPSPDGSG